MLGSADSEHPRLSNREDFQPTYLITMPQRHGRTDRRTDGRLCCINTALCVASRGKNVINVQSSRIASSG